MNLRNKIRQDILYMNKEIFKEALDSIKNINSFEDLLYTLINITNDKIANIEGR